MIPPSPTAMVTVGGRWMDLANPDPAAVVATDIAWHLAHLCRFTGACRHFYSVAQHSVYVADLLPLDGDGGCRLKLRGLLHDAHEAYCGDISAPLLRRFGRHGGADADIRGLKDSLDRAIATAFMLRWPPTGKDAEMIARADHAAFLAEWRDLMPGPLPGNGFTPAARVAAREPKEAAAIFMKRLRHLTDRAGRPARIP